MKFQKIINLAKKQKSKRLSIYEEPNSGEQWLNIGPATYRLGDLPYLTPVSLLHILSIPDEKKADWTVYADKLTDYQLLALEEDQHPADTYCQMLPVGLLLEDDYYQPFLSAGKIYLVKADLLEPFAEGIGTSYSLRDIRIPTGRTVTYMLCRNGFSLEAAIEVVPGISEPYAKAIRQIVELGEEEE